MSASLSDVDFWCWYSFEQTCFLSQLSRSEQNTICNLARRCKCCIRTKSTEKWANGTDIAASRQRLQRNKQTVLISQSCIKAKSTEKSANGTYITKLHQGKLHREISKRYLYHKAALRQTTQRNQQTEIISQSCIKAKSTEKSANGTYITKLHQAKVYREISKRYLYHKAASRQTTQRNQQTVLISQSCIKANYTEKSAKNTRIAASR